MDKKILFIDNDPEFLKTMTGLLKQHGFSVTMASSVNEARRLLERFFFHLIICDLRMENDDEEADQSGLAILNDPAIRPIPKILATFWATWEISDKVKDVVVAVAPKSKPDEFLKKIKIGFERNVKANWGLRFRGRRGLPVSFLLMAETLCPNLDPRVLPELAEEIEFGIRTMFPRAIQVQFEKGLWYFNRRLAIVIHVFEPRRAPDSRVLVIGLRDAIEEERKNFMTYGSYDTSYNTSLAQNEFFDNAKVAGHAYKTLDGDLTELQEFRSFFHSGSVEDIKNVIEQFFKQTLLPWRKAFRVDPLPHDLNSWLKKVSPGLTPENAPVFRRKLTCFLDKLASYEYGYVCQGKNLKFQINKTELSALDPTILIERNSEADNQTVFVNGPGMITGANLLTDGVNHTWLTDFFGSGPAPVLRYHVMLEFYVRFHWTVLKDTDVLAFEQALTMGDFERPVMEGAKEPLQKALEVIAWIRQLALSEKEDMASYSLGLFRLAANAILTADPELEFLPQDAVHYLHVILGCTLMAEKIIGCQKPEHVSEQRSASAIRIDKARRIVYLRGKEITLSPKRFIVFAYLFERAGEECDRQSLGELVWPNYDARSVNGISNLNSLIFRLRQDIEEDPGDPKLILKGRSGYIFYGDIRSA